MLLGTEASIAAVGDREIRQFLNSKLPQKKSSPMPCLCIYNTTFKLHHVPLAE